MSLQESDARSLGNRFSTEEDTANIHHGNTKNQPKTKYENAFHQILAALKKQLKQSHFKFSVAGEESQFTRFNGAKVRQTGQVCDSKMTLTLISAKSISSTESIATEPLSKEDSPLAEVEAGYRTTTISLPFVGEFETDWQSLKPVLDSLQTELLNLPTDPYVVLPSADNRTPGDHHSREIYAGKLLQPSQLIEALLSPVQSLDFSGLYAGGQAYRGYADSAGKQHWFETPAFTLDYSLFESVTDSKVTSKAAVKGTLAGRQWQQSDYEQSIATAKEQLTMSARACKQLQKGRYRTYLAPAAVADIIDTIACGGGLGEAALRQGNSPFSRLEKGEAVLSSQFSLGEDFQRVGR
ncbi:MAG: hypothetical protein AAFZ17_19635, partial [Cyanobacteria bacterium J06650_10]